MIAWFPAAVEMVVCGWRYSIQNNSDDARSNLWEWITFGKWVGERE